MPLYNNIQNWNGLGIEVHPIKTWRKKFRFWPYFVGQFIWLELVVKKPADAGKNSIPFHMVEKMPGVEKPRIVAPRIDLERSTPEETVFIVQDGSRITGKGEVKYWVSNRGYNVDIEPVFTAEAISLDTWVVPIMLMILGPLVGFLSGLVLGLILGG